jgi:hypothetical protein
MEGETIFVSIVAQRKYPESYFRIGGRKIHHALSANKSAALGSVVISLGGQVFCVIWIRPHKFSKKDVSLRP